MTKWLQFVNENKKFVFCFEGYITEPDILFLKVSTITAKKERFTKTTSIVLIEILSVVDSQDLIISIAEDSINDINRNIRKHNKENPK